MAWAAPSGGCGKQREPGAGAGGERASVRTGSGRRGRASHGRGQRADPAEPPAAQRRRALPDRRQRGHGQRQGTAGPRGRALSPSFQVPSRVPAPRRRMWPAAAGRVSCCSHRVARAPPLLAALQCRDLPARTTGAAAGNGRVGTRATRGSRGTPATDRRAGTLPGRQ